MPAKAGISQFTTGFRTSLKVMPAQAGISEARRVEIVLFQCHARESGHLLTRLELRLRFLID
jgi:hypothetical protein